MGTPDSDESTTDTSDSEEEELRDLLAKLKLKKQKIESEKAKKKKKVEKFKDEKVVKVKEEPLDNPRSSLTIKAEDKSTREKFQNEIRRVIAQCLKPYCHESCVDGRITSKEDFFNVIDRVRI